jgi:transposase-like protein
MTKRKRNLYTQEFKNAAVRRIQSGEITASNLCTELGISRSSLYRWCKDAGVDIDSCQPRMSNGWSSDEKFHAVIETYSMNASEIAGYCRNRGLYPEQIQEWREACLKANARQAEVHQQLRSALQEEKKSKAELERELRRKDKALAEAAALLILQKKAEAIPRVPA